MSSSKMMYEFKSALLSTGLLQPISEELDAKSLSIMCRGVPGQDKAWLKLMADILAKDIGPSMHICKRFVSKGGQMVFGWHIAINAKNAKGLKLAVGWLCEYLSTVKPELGETREVEPSAAPEAPAPRKVEALKLMKGMPPPRLPEGPPGLQSQPPAPQGFEFKMKQLDRETTEMPLPHVYRELNVPNQKDRGAKYINKGK